MGLAMRSLLGIVLLAAWAGPLHADIYECEEPGGGKRCTNIKAEAKGCKQLTVTPNVISQRPPVGSPAGRPSLSPDGFPKVAPQVQQQRDNDRKKIVEAELTREDTLVQEARGLLA